MGKLLNVLQDYLDEYNSTSKNTMNLGERCCIGCTRAFPGTKGSLFASSCIRMTCSSSLDVHPCSCAA